MVTVIVQAMIDGGYIFLTYDGKRLDIMSVEYCLNKLHLKEYVDIDITRELKDNETIAVRPLTDLLFNAEAMTSAYGDECSFLVKEETNMCSRGVYLHVCTDGFGNALNSKVKCLKKNKAHTYHAQQALTISHEGGDMIQYLYNNLTGGVK